MKSRCSKSLYSYDLLTSRWAKCATFGKQPAARRHHCAVLVGSDMLVYGGVGGGGCQLDDLFMLNLTSCIWKEPRVGKEGGPGARSHFSFTPAFAQGVLQETALSAEEIAAHRHLHLLKNSGIYLFGGLDAENCPTNDLFVLCFTKKAARWTGIQCSGSPPAPRHSHAACFMNSYLFIFGGRNDLLSNFGFNDLHLFNVEHLKWEQPIVSGQAPGARWAHCMLSCANKVLVLGGLNSKNFMGSELFSLETDQECVEELNNRRSVK